MIRHSAGENTYRCAADDSGPSEEDKRDQTLSRAQQSRSTEKEKTDSVEVFTALIRSIKRSQAELLKLMEEKQKAAERQAEGLIKELEQEITIYSSMCSPPHTKNWTEISINTGLSGDTVRTALSQLQQTLNKRVTKTLNDKLKEIVSTELKRIQQYAVDVTLDPDTAHPYLILSADGKQVKGKTDWDFGVATESIKRKGKINPSPKYGLWTVALRNENQYKARAGPAVPLTLREKLEVVGMFVDYEEGLVSFYDVKSRSHIYSFTGQSFTERLYPYLSPSLNEG
ncbi:hypothetical protein QTP70_032181, partial [Hemibagrus guttatus]